MQTPCRVVANSDSSTDPEQFAPTSDGACRCTGSRSTGHSHPMSRRAPSLPDQWRSTSFSSTATEPWMPYSRTRARDILHPFHGVAAHDIDLDDLVQLAHAYGHRAHHVVAISHGSAARLHGLPLPRRLERDELLHVCRLDSGRAPRGRGIRGHRWQLGVGAKELHLLVAPSSGEALPVGLLSPIATAATLAHSLSCADLVAVLDALVMDCERSEAATLLERGLSLVHRRPGAAKFARAVPLVRTGVRSRAETLLRLLLRDARLPEPTVAQPVTTPNGLLHPDLQWADFGVVLEYEGEEHRVSKRRFRRDIHRFDAFLDADHSPIRATAVDVFEDPTRVLGVVERRLRDRGWRPHARWTLRVPAPAVQ